MNSVGKKVELPSGKPGSEREESWPRLMYRYRAAEYMGLSLRKFDEIKHLFRVVVDGVVRYDKVLMDRYIDLSHAA